MHQNNPDVLLCRICEKDLDSSQALTGHMRGVHGICEMPYICQLCHFRSSIYTEVVDHFKQVGWLSNSPTEALVNLIFSTSFWPPKRLKRGGGARFWVGLLPV